MNKLPVYELIIDEETTAEEEVQKIAFVDKPAIEKNFLAFNAIKLDFATDAARQIVSGPAMVPDTLIYRRDTAGEYNVFFSKETIEKIALKFFKKDYQKNLNLFHDPNLSLQGVTIFESFVSDKARGVQPMKGFEDLPDGTWFISAKVENPAVWAKIISGEVKGFSVEGIFSYMKKPQSIENKLQEALNGTLSEISHLHQTEIMSKITDFVASIKKQFFDGTPMTAPVVPAPVVAAPAATTPQSLTTDYTTADGSTVQIDRLEVGGVVLMGGLPAPAGDYTLQDGTKLTVGEGGVITLLTPVAAAAAVPALTMADVEGAIQKALAASMTEIMSSINLIKGDTTAQQKMTAQDEQIKALFTAIEMMAAVPTADSIDESAHQSFNKDKAQSKEEKRAAIVRFLKRKKVS